MALQQVQLRFQSDPAPFCCPACGHQIFTDTADGSFCDHIVFSFEYMTMESIWNNDTHENTFLIAAEQEATKKPEWNGDIDDFLHDLSFDEVVDLMARTINTPSAFMLSINNWGIGCGGSTGSTFCVVIDYQPPH